MTRAEKIEKAARLVLMATCIDEEHQHCPPMEALREALALPVTDQELLDTIQACCDERDRRDGFFPVVMEMVPVPPTSTTEAMIAPPDDAAPPTWEVDQTWSGDYLDGVVAAERVIVRASTDELGLTDTVAYCFDRETADLIARAPAMLGVLREVEFGDHTDFGDYCPHPTCNAERPGQHGPTCQLNAVLRG